MKSCATCKYFKQETEDHGYCEYPVPAWLIISVGSPGRDMSLMPSRYTPCPTWLLNDEELLSQKEEDHNNDVQAAVDGLNQTPIE